jgi:LEA14-like dessication related protein
MRARHRSTWYLILGLAVAPLLSGCALLQQLLQGMGRPTASLAGVQLTQLSLSGVTLNFAVKIKNPYAVDLPLANADYRLASNGQVFLEGRADLQGVIPPQGEKVFTLPTTVGFPGLLQVLTAVKPGALVPFEATLGLSLKTQALGLIRVPLTHNGQLPIPTIPAISVVAVRWASLGLSGVSGSATLRVGNTNAFPVDLSTLEYGLRLGSFEIAKGGLTQAVSFAPGGTQDLTIAVGLSTAQAGLALLNLARGSSGRYALEGAFAVGTPFGPLRIPYSVGGDVPFFR